jgi:hypothetical protein
MRPIRLAGFALILAALASCAPRPAPPAPPPPPPAPPPPAPAPPAPAVGWEDAPASPGDWRYREEGAGSAASFGTAQDPQFVISCGANRQVSLSRRGAAGGSSLVVRTSFGDRSLPGAALDGGVTASLAASDPLLDWMVFSRGRFAVEAEGSPRLVIPAWPEPARVIEDCRS